MNFNICHPLRGICVALNLVGAHLEKRQWISSTFDEVLLPESSDLLYFDEVGALPREDSKAMVAYNTSGFIISPVNVLSRPLGGNIHQLSGVLKFTVSTTNKALTRELLFEIGSLFAATRSDLMNYSFTSTNIAISPVSYDEKNYYVGSVDVSAFLGHPIWKTEYDCGILREIGIWLDTKDPNK